MTICHALLRNVNINSENMVRISIPGAAVAKGRPRATTVNGRVRNYTPAKTAKYEKHARECAQLAMRKQKILTGPVCCFAQVLVPIPKSWSKRKKKSAENGELLPTTRPDVDNYVKASLDACNAIVFEDDSQITDLFVQKRYSHTPCTTLVFLALPNLAMFQPVIFGADFTDFLSVSGFKMAKACDLDEEL